MAAASGSDNNPMAAAGAAAPVVAPSATPPASVARVKSVSSAPSKEEQLLVCVRSDWPVNEVVCTVSSLLTVAGLRTELGKQLGITQSLSQYEMRVVSLGKDVLSLGVKGDHQLISEAGVGYKSTIFLAAPASIKPAKLKPKKKSAKKKKKDDGSGDEKESAADRYKGLSVKTILKELADANASGDADPPKKQLEFFDIYCEKIILQPEFMSLKPALLMKLIKRDQLNVPEIALFEALVRWGTKNKKSDEKEPLMAAIKEFLPHIRFPSMEMGEIASKVAGTNLLSPDQLLQLYTYLGSSQKDASKVPWTARARVGRRPPAWFKWDATKKGNTVQVSSDGMTVNHNGAQWASVFADKEIGAKARAEWELVLDQYDTSNSYNIVVGVCPTTMTQWQYNSIVGYSGAVPGWGFITGNGQKLNNSSAPQAYGQPCYAGTTIKVVVDMKKATMEVFVNKQSCGVMYNNLYGSVRPYMSLTQNQKVTLKFPKSGGSGGSGGSDD